LHLLSERAVLTRMLCREFGKCYAAGGV